MAKKTQCKATKTIEDECSIMPYRCELESGHTGNHRATYPGQWGEVSYPVEWKGKSPRRTVFHRNNRSRFGVACPGVLLTALTFTVFSKRVTPALTGMLRAMSVYVPFIRFAPPPAVSSTRAIPESIGTERVVDGSDPMFWWSLGDEASGNVFSRMSPT